MHCFHLYVPFWLKANDKIVLSIVVYAGIIFRSLIMFRTCVVTVHSIIYYEVLRSTALKALQKCGSVGEERLARLHQWEALAVNRSGQRLAITLFADRRG